MIVGHVSISRSSFVVTVSRTKELLPIQAKESTMKSFRSVSIWIAGILAAGMIWLGLAGTVAQAADKSDVNAAAAFTKLKTLAGTWEAPTKQGKSTTSYEVIS